MRKSRFTEEQIAYALKQTELSTKVEDICRNMKQLEEENSKLNRPAVDLSLDKFTLQDILSKNRC